MPTYVKRPPKALIAQALSKTKLPRTPLYRITRGVQPTRVDENFAPHRPTWAQFTGKGGLDADDFQATGATWMIDNERGFLCDDMGLGKSKQFIDAMEHVAANTDDMRVYESHYALILCEASNVDVWLDELDKNAPNAPKFAYRGGKDRVNGFRQFTQREYGPLSYVIVSYSTFRNDYQELCGIKYMACALDEGQACKSTPLNEKSQSQISQRIFSINAGRKYVITGTPILNAPLDLFTPMRWLGIEPLTWEQWSAYTCNIISIPVSRWASVNKITRYTDDGLARLKKLFYAHMIRRTKDDKLDLPGQLPPQTREVMMTAVEVAEYNKMEAVYERAVADLEKGEEPAVNPNVAQMRLKQLTSSIPSMVVAAVQAANEAVGSGQKVIIYTQHLETLRMLYKSIPSTSLAYIHGGVSVNAAQNERSERQQQVDKFQNDPNCTHMIATSQSCRVGLTLTAASVVIFIDEEWSPKNVQQNIDRANRIGQTRPVTVIKLRAVRPPKKVGRKPRQTIAGQIARVLAQKNKMADAVVEGRATPRAILDIMKDNE